jgi:glutamate-5-semialdehyde dehydrogenase
MSRRKTSAAPRAAVRRKAKPPSAGDYREELVRLCVQARQAGQTLALASTDAKNRALESMAEALKRKEDEVLFQNGIDVEAGRRASLPAALLDRLTLTAARVADMARGLRAIAALPDPVGEVVSDEKRPNGMRLQKVRVPLGVVAMVYEARPNVTVDSAGLCLKSGNAVILRGGKESFNSNAALARVLREALASAGLPEAAVQTVATTDRAAVRDLVRLDRWIDLVIPRGGEEMVNAIREAATVPVLSHGKGLCSIYVDKDADLDMAERIAFNAKVQRPGVCNAMETLLVHKDAAGDFVPRMVRRYAGAKVEVRGDDAARRLGGAAVKRAVEADWDTEFLDLTVAVRVVDSLDDAVRHINHHGSHHSDGIVTRDAKAAESFLARVDSAAVLHNASTRLHDGGVFGLGAEMGISTQKLHARGTMGLRELTTTKYVVRGTGQIRE